MSEEEFCHVLVGNIPSKFHSVDLRSFFSQFVETGKFDCFHFRHRPEILKRKNTSENEETREVKGKTTCCVVRLKKENVKELLDKYDGENWTDRNGKLCSQKVTMSRIFLKEIGCSSDTYKTRKEAQSRERERIEFVKEDLMKLSELRPPSFMPNGNIGTNLDTFMSLIRSCQLPTHVIKKLGLTFPMGRSKRCYGNVKYDYGCDNECGVSLSADDDVKKSQSERESIDTESDEIPSKQSYTKEISTTENKRNQLNDEVSRHESSDSESEAEEDWERHEALHDDVDCQGRTKERLFENDIELKWEKGGSGLVFYTDAAYWDKLNGDVDEQTADDWDIDMSIYEKGGYGDRNSKALMEMRVEEQRHFNVNDSVSIDSTTIGDFEKHTKGFGSKLMKNHGWTEGTSLGSSQVGIIEPIPTEGQLPYCKTGLGYYGEKLNRKVKRRRVEKDVVISTVFDNQEDENISTPWQSAGPFTIKYRKKVDFVQEKQNKTNA